MRGREEDQGLEAVHQQPALHPDRAECLTPRGDESIPREPEEEHEERSTGTASSAVDYELFNSSNVSIRYWSWNYRGCWHQTCPPVDTHCGV